MGTLIPLKTLTKYSTAFCKVQAKLSAENNKKSSRKSPPGRAAKDPVRRGPVFSFCILSDRRDFQICALFPAVFCSPARLQADIGMLMNAADLREALIRLQSGISTVRKDIPVRL